MAKEVIDFTTYDELVFHVGSCAIMAEDTKKIPETSAYHARNRDNGARMANEYHRLTNYAWRVQLSIKVYKRLLLKYFINDVLDKIVYKKKFYPYDRTEVFYRWSMEEKAHAYNRAVQLWLQNDNDTPYKENEQP